MATALDVIHVAQQQVGFVEGANNANPYGDWYGLPNEPYCAMGVSWCFEQAQAKSLSATLPWPVQGGCWFIYDHAMSTSSRPESKLGTNLEVDS